MENADKTMTEQESLLLIGQMIRNAQESVKENGFIYLLWGWLVFATALMNYVLLYILHSEYAYLPWPIMMTLGGIASMVYSSRKRKTQLVKTQTGNFMRYHWISYGAALAFILFYMMKVGPEIVYPVIILIYGMGTFVSGGAMAFRPLIIGGICCWIIAVVSVFFGFQVQLLLLCLAILIAYIIPGHILKARFAHEKI